jgi:two-component system cell cycle sensor histidine kinase/response regulator CckA
MTSGGVLTIETAIVDSSSNGPIEGALPAPHARLIVADTGTGMPADVKARVFEPFFTTREMGTGLGLSSVAFTVRQLEGTVGVQSQAGRGTTVTVCLPWSAVL